MGIREKDGGKKCNSLFSEIEFVFNKNKLSKGKEMDNIFKCYF